MMFALSGNDAASCDDAAFGNDVSRGTQGLTSHHTAAKRRHIILQRNPSFRRKTIHHEK